MMANNEKIIEKTYGQDLLLTIFLGEITFVHYGKIVAKNMKWSTLEKQMEEAFFFPEVSPLLIHGLRVVCFG